MQADKNQDMRIIYMGTPEFAVPPLQMLCENGYRVELVVTQPDKARDRGKKLQPTPVKVKAQEYGIEVLQPEKIRENDEFIGQIRKANPDLIVVAAYGKILPPDLLGIPRLGCVNIHASLLPKYRGAAPIHRSIINGEEQTGVTLMYMEEGLDTGDMIASRSTEIGRKTVSMLHDELSQMGAELLIDTLSEIKAGSNRRTQQDDRQATYAPMIFKKEGHVDFSRSPAEVERLIRGMNSWPGAYAVYKGEVMKLWQAEPLEKEGNAPNGTILAVSEKGMEVAAGGKTLLIQTIQMPGKKAMPVSEYIKGNRIITGERLE